MPSHSGVSIYYVPTDGELWAKYAEEKLSSREYELKCILNDSTCQKAFHVPSTAVNVFFITPDFLDHAIWANISSLNKDTCVIILTGVDMCDLETAARVHNCDQVLAWYIHELEQSEESVREMILSIIGVYESTDPLPHLVHATGTLPRVMENGGIMEHAPGRPPRVTANGGNATCMVDDTDTYDRLPCDVRQVNSSVAAFKQDGMIYLLLERQPESDIRIEVDGKAQHPVATTYVVYTLRNQTTRSNSITVFQDDNQIGEHAVSHVNEFHCHVQEAQDRLSCLNQHHVYTQTETQNDEDDPQPPPACTSGTNVTYINLDDVRRNSSSSLKSDASDISTLTPAHKSSPGTPPKRHSISKLDQIRELLVHELDPVQLLCRCLEIENDARALDDKLTSLVEITDALKHMSVSPEQKTIQEDHTCSWPTVVHFGARFNFIRFCNSVLSNPLMHRACLIRNKDGHLPEDIARDCGHAQLAEILRQFTYCVRHSVPGRADKYDSGLSGLETPRLSTITLTEEEDGPPSPHLSFINSKGYVNMNVDGNADTVASPDDPFSDITDFPKSDGSSKMRSHSNESDVSIEDESGQKYRRKDINSHLGISQTVTKEKKKQKRGLFSRLRSHSSGEVAVDNISTHKKKETKSYKRDSPRSSGTSSSTASISSETSLREIEEEVVELRSSKKKSKGKGNLTMVVNSAKRRQSIRVRRAMNDQNLAGPTLPERKPRVVEFPDL